MLDTKCAICGNNKNTKTLYKERINYNNINSKTFSARRTPDRMHYRFLKCNRCGLIFSNPIFNKKEINNLYLKSNFNYAKESEYLKKTYFNYFKNKVLDKNSSKNLKILEIGAGNGFFLEELKDNGFKNVYGIEPGRLSVEKARKDIKKNIKINVLEPNLYPKNHFDIICCFHTLDHIIEPNVFLAEVYSLLKQGGKTFFIVHNTKGLSVKLLKEKSPIFDIEHIYLFNPETLKKIFEKNRFKQSKVFNIKNNYPLSYWVKLFPIPKSFKKIVINLLTITKMGLIPFSLSAGNIGIVSHKKVH